MNLPPMRSVLAAVMVLTMVTGLFDGVPAAREPVAAVGLANHDPSVSGQPVAATRAGSDPEGGAPASLPAPGSAWRSGYRRRR